MTATYALVLFTWTLFKKLSFKHVWHKSNASRFLLTVSLDSLFLTHCLKKHQIVRQVVEGLVSVYTDTAMENSY
jgi:hypothetical protein